MVVLGNKRDSYFFSIVEQIEGFTMYNVELIAHRPPYKAGIINICNWKSCYRKCGQTLKSKKPNT